MRIISILLCLMSIALAAFPMSEPNKGSKIHLDGNTTDFDAENDQVILSSDLLGKYFESDSDSKWGSQNELISFKLTWDSSYLYFGLDGVLEGDNSILVYLDSGAGAGVDYVSSLDLKKRRIQFKGLKPDYFFIAENNNPNPGFYKINSTSSVTYFINYTDPVMISTLKNDVRAGFEARISWDRLFGLGGGRVPAGTHIKLVGCLSGGDDSTTVDSAPDSSMSLPSQWDQTAVLDNYLDIPIDENSDQFPDMNVNIRNRVLVAIDTTSLKYQPLAIMNLTLKNQCFSPNNDNINDEMSINYYLTKNATVDVDIFNLDGDLIYTVVRNTELTAGYQSVTWNGNDKRGVKQATGLYVVNIKAKASGVSVARRIGVYLLD